MALDKSDWLSEAKKLSVGGTKRIYHGAEQRPNLVIQNLPDRYTAYCHKCHQGGVHPKEHAFIGVVPDQERRLTWPGDVCSLEEMDGYQRNRVLGLLAVKGIDYTAMLSGPFAPLYSAQQRRLIFPTALGWLGRATANQNPKWCNYTYELPYGQHPSDSLESCQKLILTEDYLSVIKLRWALRHDSSLQKVGAIALLGTHLRTAVLAAIIEQAKRVHVYGMFDGDDAGRKCNDVCAKRFGGLGIPFSVIHTPTGYDPKDLHSHELLSIIKPVLEK